MGSKENLSLKVVGFRTVKGVHWEVVAQIRVVTHVRGCFGQCLLPHVMPDPLV